MKKSNFIAILVVLIICVFMMLTTANAQESRVKNLAKIFAGAMARLQQYCIEQGKVECELLELTDYPPFLREGQVIDYVGVRTRGVLYFYFVVAETNDMDPDIFLFDSSGKLISGGANITGYADVALHVPGYTQKVIQRIKMYRGNGYIATGVLAPVGSQ